MTKASAYGLEQPDPERDSGRPGPAQIEDWLQRAMADLVRNGGKGAEGSEDEMPIDLTQSLAAMAALLHEAFRPGRVRAAQDRGVADDAPAGRPAALASPPEPRAIAAPFPASGDKSQERRPSGPEPAPQPPATPSMAAPAPPAAGDALADLIELMRKRLSESFETGLAAAARETRGLKDAVQTLALKIEAPREGAAHDGWRISREVAELRDQQSEADNRLHLALNAVQETVGRVDHRLARVEAGLGAISREVSPPPAAPAARQSPARPRGTAGAQRAEIDQLLIEPGAGFPPRQPAPRPHADAPATPAPSAGAAPEPPRDEQSSAGRLIAPAPPGRDEKARPPGARHAHAKPVLHKPILLGLVALALAIGAYALARNEGLRRRDPPPGAVTRLRPAPRAGAPREESDRPARPDPGRRAPNLPQDPAADSGPADASRLMSVLLDPTFFESARTAPRSAAPPAIAGSEPPVGGEITAGRIPGKAAAGKSAAAKPRGGADATPHVPDRAARARP